LKLKCDDALFNVAFNSTYAATPWKVMQRGRARALVEMDMGGGSGGRVIHSFTCKPLEMAERVG
jgi:hypothetical protein